MLKKLEAIKNTSPDPKQLTVRVVPDELVRGGAELVIDLAGHRKPELRVSQKVAGDPAKMQKVMAWAEARLRGDIETCRRVKGKGAE